MLIFVAALVAGGLAGVSSGGRLSNLGTLRVRGWALLAVSFGAQAVLGQVPGGGRWILAFAACGAIVAWCVVNRRAAGRSVGTGLSLLALGIAANAVAIAANGGMPVSPAALVGAGLAHMDVARGHLYKHVFMTAQSHLQFLGDIIPLRLARTVASPGDMCMLAGIAIVVWSATRGAAPRSTGPNGQSNASTAVGAGA